MIDFEPGNSQHRSELLDLYKLSVEMADRISARRGTANAFFVSVESVLATVLAVFSSVRRPDSNLGVIVVAIVGVSLSAAWWLQLRSYRDLNKAKFRSILAMETDLLFQPFAREWEELKTDRVERWRDRYAELGFSERVVPAMFAALYVVLASSQVARCPT